jgi:hypothetical protein
MYEQLLNLSNLPSQITTVLIEGESGGISTSETSPYIYKTE